LLSLIDHAEANTNLNFIQFKVLRELVESSAVNKSTNA
jgi:hypothetical protein